MKILKIALISLLFSNLLTKQVNANDIKTKLLSQLHRNNRLYPSDEEFKKYIRNEAGCTRFLESVEDLIFNRFMFFKAIPILCVPLFMVLSI